MNSNPLLNMVGGNVDDNLQDKRLWKALEGINQRLSSIDEKLEHVVRLDERVNNHETVISRYGKRLDEGDYRMRKIELWQAEHNPDLIITTIKSNAEVIDNVKQEIHALKETGNIQKGQRDVGKEVLKWVAGILAAIIIYQATRGS